MKRPVATTVAVAIIIGVATFETAWFFFAAAVSPNVDPVLAVLAGIATLIVSIAIGRGLWIGNRWAFWIATVGSALYVLARLTRIVTGSSPIQAGDLILGFFELWFFGLLVISYRYFLSTDLRDTEQQGRKFGDQVVGNSKANSQTSDSHRGRKQVRVEIHFHEQDEVSVFLESNVFEDAERKNIEVLMFDCYALRQMINLMGSQVSGNLAEMLRVYKDDINAIIYADLEGMPNIVQYAGRPGRKRFEANLTIDEKGYTRFILHLHGFDVIGHTIQYYAPLSTFVLLRYLMQKRRDDNIYLNSICYSANLCSNRFLGNEITSRNHIQVAIMTAREAIATVASASERHVL